MATIGRELAWSRTASSGATTETTAAAFTHADGSRRPDVVSKWPTRVGDNAVEVAAGGGLKGPQSVRVTVPWFERGQAGTALLARRDAPVLPFAGDDPASEHKQNAGDQADGALPIERHINRHRRTSAGAPPLLRRQCPSASDLLSSMFRSLLPTVGKY